MKTSKIISGLNKKGISFSIVNLYNEFNKEIIFSFNEVNFEADITTGKCNGFINENGRVYSSLKQIIK